jgi:hypothetical protein
MYIKSVKSMKINFTFKTMLTVAEKEALLDSGASENFIDTEVWRELRIGRFRLARSIPVHNMDGMINKQGNIEYYCWLKVRFPEECYYKHFCSLVRILNLCLQFEISEKDIDEIESGIRDWVVDYEQCIPPFRSEKLKTESIHASSLYYQHKPE